MTCRRSRRTCGGRIGRRRRAPAGHPWDGTWPNGVQSRYHKGPVWGDHVYAAALEYDTAPGMLQYVVTVDQAEDWTTEHSGVERD